MFYTQHDFPVIPQDLKDELIVYAKEHVANQHEFNYGWFNTTDKDDLSYIASKEAYEAEHGVSGPVIFLAIPQPILTKLVHLYKDVSELQQGFFSLQVNYNIDTFPPHIDMLRSITRMYLLEPGGKNVVTSWYEPKEEFKHLPYDHPVNFIHNNRLIKIKSAVLDTDCWYDLEVNKIHGVEHIEDYRISVAFILS